jgi:hypothetical protein
MVHHAPALSEANLMPDAMPIRSARTAGAISEVVR